MSQPLTYEDLAIAYKKETGQSALVQSMDSVLDWATERTDLFKTDAEGYFYAIAPRSPKGEA